MSDAAPGESLRALVASAVDGDLSGPSASVAVAERGDDPAPRTRLADIAAGGDSIVGVVPRIDPSLARRVGAAIDGEIRLVFTGRAADRLDGPAGAAVRSALSGRGVEAYRHGGDSPVGVLLVGDRAVVGLFDDRGLAAALWSDAPPIREWAAATCRRFLDAADPM